MTEKRDMLVADLEKRLNSEEMRGKIAEIEKKFDLVGCKRNVLFSDFKQGGPVLVFEPSEEQFENIIREHKPEVYYKEINVDDAGNWGYLSIIVDPEIEISSKQYIFGYIGVWNELSEKMGYKDEVKTSGFKNSSGKFVPPEN
ncbi:MAG TPA: hypothetical protein VFI61_04385 [Patescibacteria group bacterium]|nr:hypothetical protein [Patescibacteria group bacterium]